MVSLFFFPTDQHILSPPNKHNYGANLILYDVSAKMNS